MPNTTYKIIKPRMISVIGPNSLKCSPEIYKFGVELGTKLVDNNFWIICGGKNGLMEAVCRGAHDSEKYTFGCTIGIIPETDKQSANAFCDIIIPTGIGFARNFLVVQAGDIIVSVGGGAGTLSELAFAWQLKKKVICVTSFGGWSKKLAKKKLDITYDFEFIESKSINGVINDLKKLL